MKIFVVSSVNIKAKFCKTNLVKRKIKMANTVLQATTQEIQKMKEAYKAFIPAASPPGSIFTAKPPGCTITAYKSGKVLFQGKNAEAEALKWNIKPAPSASKPKKDKPAHAYAPPENVGSLSLIGSDEVGTGDFSARSPWLHRMCRNPSWNSSESSGSKIQSF